MHILKTDNGLDSVRYFAAASSFFEHVHIRGGDGISGCQRLCPGVEYQVSSIVKQEMESGDCKLLLVVPGFTNEGRI